MKSFSNIEKSAYKRFTYVGYGRGKVWLIRKTGFGGWEAMPQGERDYSQHIRASTLAEMSDKLSRD
jgi:hypothetical protein